MYWSTCANYFTFPGSQDKDVSDQGDLFFCRWKNTSCCAQNLPGLDLNRALRLPIKLFPDAQYLFSQYNWRNNLKTCKWKFQTPVSRPSAFLHIISLFFIIVFPFFSQIKHPCMTPLKSDPTVEVHTASQWGMFQQLQGESSPATCKRKMGTKQ